MPEVNLLTIEQMKHGELMNTINDGIQKCAQDIASRESVSGKRTMDIRMTFEEESGIVKIGLERVLKMPKTPAMTTIGYIKDGKLIANPTADDVMKQPKLAEVSEFKKTGTNNK